MTKSGYLESHPLDDGEVTGRVTVTNELSFSVWRQMFFRRNGHRPFRTDGPVGDRHTALLRPIGRLILTMVLVLVGASVLGTTLLTGRVAISHQFTHVYLVWNLLLAWIPLGFASAAWFLRRHTRSLIVVGALWLLFFPNAWYLVTDFVHLRPHPPVPLWFDIVLLQSFVWTGLLLGSLSLFLVQNAVIFRFGRIAGWLLVVSAIALAAFGLYLGRVERWNSWSIFSDPITLFTDVARHARPPQRRSIFFFCLAHGSFFMIVYGSLYCLTRCALGNARPNPNV